MRRVSLLVPVSSRILIGRLLFDVIGVRRRCCSDGKMQEAKKREKAKKRRRSDREHSDGEMKSRNTESSAEEPEASQEPSDLEEGGLDLNKIFRPISSYVQDRREMLEQCLHVLGENKLKNMLPDELKDCSFSEIKTLCWDQLQQLSEMHLLEILEGKELSAEPEEKNFPDSQQDSNVDSTSSLRENPETEEKQSSGEDSDVLSINADVDDSDIEGHKALKAEEEAPPRPDEPRVELQHDIDRSVSEILARSGSGHSHQRQASLDTAAAPETEKQPSTQQLELLELEMRARAIKALMKASEAKKQ